MSSDATQPLATAPSPPTGGGKWSPLLTTVVIVAGVLLLTVVALVSLLIGRGIGNTDAASDTSSLGPTPTVTSPSDVASEEAQDPAEQQDEPVDNSTHFTSFNAPTETVCDPDAEQKPKIQVSWTSENATEAWFAPDDGDASDGTGYAVPVNGNQDDIVDNDHEFPCQHRGEQDYTITLVGPGGEKVSEHWTVVDPNFGN